VLVSTFVVITLAAGAGSWFLAAQSTRTNAISEVLSSAKSFGSLQGGGLTFNLPHIKARAAVVREELLVELRLFERTLRLTSNLASAKLLVPTNPAALTDATVPKSVLDSVAASTAVGPSSAVGGSTGSKAWAVELVEFRFVVSLNGAPINLDYRRVLVLTRTIGSPSVTGALVLAGAMVAFAVIAGLVITRRLTRPLRRAVATTERIAAGDLDARVGAPPGGFPELSALANAIDRMAESLGALRNAERQFLLSVSHELRSPLTSIRGYSEAILDGTVADPTHAAAVIGNESRRLERLVGDLLDLAKLDAKTFSFHFRTVDVTEVVEEVAEELRPVADTAGLELLVRPPERPLLARVDPDRLDQVLANLVENAAKFARTTITLGTIANGHEAQLVVEDDGPGIPAEELGRIFERHYSTDRHARPGRPRGSGLGLAIASELSAAMGATVRAESPTGNGGTRMVVRLPVLATDQPA
jgi:signal transduction histidine kinase